jgi:glycosyltransferase involved in cell wall biosynthesis
VNRSGKKTTWHVYYGARGCAGAYVDALLTASRDAHLPARAFVSAAYAYPRRDVTRAFFWLTDRTERRGRALKLLRGLELLIGYIAIALAAAVRRPRIQLHYTDNLPMTWWFYRLCRWAGLEVWVTCHDVDAPGEPLKPHRRRILATADRLVIHSRGAAEALIRHLGPDVTRRIVRYPFPFASYDSILDSRKVDRARHTLDELLAGCPGRYFLFAGVLRKRKGLETLLDAWDRCDLADKATLVLAGKWSFCVPDQLKRRAEATANCRILPRFLTNEEFTHFLARAWYVVLPYLDYAHSSVLISAANHGAACIVSDIELFTEYLPDYEMTFPAGDAEALADLLARAACLEPSKVEAHRRILRQAVGRSQQALVQRLANCMAA